MTSAEPVVKEVFINAPRQRVFDYIVDPAKIVRWIGLQADFNPVAGGAVRIDANGRDVIRGEVIEIVRPSRIVFTWGYENSEEVPAGSTLVEITLQAEGGGTRLRLIHRELPPDSRAQHDLGWTHYLDRLRNVAAGNDVGPDPWADPEFRHG